MPAKVTQTKLSPITGDGGGISKITAPKGPVMSGIQSVPTLLRGGNKKTKSGGEFTTLTERQFLQDKSKPTISYAPTVTSLISNITSSVKNVGSWWRNAGDAQLKKNKQMNNVVKNQLGLSAGKSQF